MKRVRVTQYVEAPANGADSSAIAPVDFAAPIVAGHPALVRFAPGPEIPDDSEDELTATAEHDRQSQTIRVNLSGNEGRWLGQFAPASEYMIAVVDKVNGTAKIVETAGEFAFSQVVALKASGTGNKVKSEDTRTYRQKRGDLLGEFGGKRAKDRQAKMERNAITDERVSTKAAAQLEGVIEAHQQVKAVKKSGPGTTSVFAPPYNAEATHVEDAYPLLGLMSTAEYTHLNGEAQSFVRDGHEPTAGNPGWHDMCWRLMRQSQEATTKDEPDLEEQKRRVIAAMYLHYLISIVNLQSRRIGVRERNELLEVMAVPEEILDALLCRFSEQREGKSDRVKSETSDGRLTYYAVVLWLTANGFEVTSGFEEVASALGIGKSQLFVHCKYVGCQVKRRTLGETESQDARGLRIRLGAPLVFPPLRKARMMTRR